MPPATITTSPVMCPAARSESRNATVRAMSSVRATLRSGIVAVTLSTSSSVSDASVIGDTVQPGATTLTRAGAISFLSDSRRPWPMAALAAAEAAGPALAEAAGGRADQDECAAALEGEAAAGQERGGEVG